MSLFSQESILVSYNVLHSNKKGAAMLKRQAKWSTTLHIIQYKAFSYAKNTLKMFHECK